MRKVTDISITTELTSLNLLVSGIALLLACVAFTAYDLSVFRQSMVRTLSIQAQIIGFNSISALIFNDPHSAESTLSALKANPNIVAAEIYTVAGKAFAGYERGQKSVFQTPLAVPASRSEIHWFRDGKLTLVRRIAFQGKPAGIVLLQSSMQQLERQMVRRGVIAGAVLLVSLTAALLISSIFRRTVAEPILRLAEMARTVAREKSYSVRVLPSRNRDELAFLMESFNEMLDQIQARDRALEEAHAGLERRVEQRTRQLTAANKELEAFSYSVSHDLRAPLRQIDGFSKILLEEHASQLDATAGRYLGLIRDGAKNMGELVDDLLNLGWLGREELVRKPVELNPLVESVLRDLRPEWEGRKIDWRVESLPTMDCDRVLMRQVFVNLISNAVKYTRRREAAVIEVGQMRVNGNPAILVRDNGTGFEMQYVHKLFGVFQRLHRAEDYEGTGVGLAIVQRIIQKHGGRVWAEAEVDKGATFFFTLGSGKDTLGSEAEVSHDSKGN
ncbi:MAG: ATP-binding protein [Terriglobia bacterium]